MATRHNPEPYDVRSNDRVRMASAQSEKSAPIRYSIVITCYNQEHYIEHAIRSVLTQDTTSKEIIVVDDGSTDASAALLANYQDVVKLVCLSKNSGATEARNHGAAVATGEYLIFLDGDDLFTPWALKVYDRLIAQRSPTTILSGARRFEGPVPILGLNDLPKEVEFIEYGSLMAKDRGHGINNGAFVIGRRAFENVGGWSPEFYHLDGQDLYAKLGYSGRAIVVCSPYTLFYRMHGGNSIHCIRSFLQAAHVIVDREHAGQYPGGRDKRFERWARHGGTIGFCIKRGWGAGLYREILKLAVHGWRMILTRCIRQLSLTARARQPVEFLSL